MQAVTALVHLYVGVIVMLDLDPACKYSITDQVNLFLSLKPVLIKNVLFCALIKLI
jgi:GTP1/Obg family GTP-binding protein